MYRGVPNPIKSKQQQQHNTAVALGIPSVPSIHKAIHV
jgi:hypothetical protein